MSNLKLFPKINNCLKLENGIIQSTLKLAQSKTQYSLSPFQYKTTYNLKKNKTEENKNEMMRKTVHGRRLPKQLINFGSKEGIELFKETLEKGYSNNYFSLAGNFTTQSHPAYCGLGTLCMVLNAVEVDPEKRWKGIWRWWADDMLECCYSLEHIRKKGIDFRDFTCISRCNGLTVIPKRAENYTKEEFIHDVEMAVQTYDTHIIVSYSRKGLGQTGDGHYSPIAGLHKDTDNLLILDVARYKYPSYWCKTTQLWESMKRIDKVTGHSRGYFIVKKADRTAIPLCKFNAEPDDWENLSNFYLNTISNKIKNDQPQTPKEIIYCILEEIPENANLFILPNYTLGPMEASKQLLNLVDEAKASYYFKIIDEFIQFQSHNKNSSFLKFFNKYPLKEKLQENLGITITSKNEYEMKITMLVIWLMSCPGEIFENALSEELYSIYEKSHDPSRMTGAYVTYSKSVNRSTPVLCEEVKRMYDYQSIALHSVHSFINDMPKSCESLLNFKSKKN